MTWQEIVLIVIGVLLVIGAVIWNLAQRVDRLHRRVTRSRAVLEAQLSRRAEAAVELATSGALDPASSVIVTEAAWRAGIHARRLVGADADDLQALLSRAPASAEPAAAQGRVTEPSSDAEQESDAGLDRAMAESELTAALRSALGTSADVQQIGAAGGAQALASLEQADYRVQLARRFHNDAVIATQQLRAGPLVRIFHLAGRTPMPQTVEMDDAVFTGGPAGRP